MRAGRVLRLMLLLQSRGRLSATELAELLEVSVRTVHRDIEHLSAAGVPVYARRGRTGGFELLDGWRSQLTGLTAGEAAALFLAGVPGLADALGRGDELATAELKLVASNTSDDPLRLRTRFHVDPERWFASEDEVPCLQTWANAMWQDQKVHIVYESWTTVSSRSVAPLGVVVKAGVWYGVALDGDRPLTFRLSQIRSIRAQEPFVRPSTFDLASYWTTWAAAYERSRFTMSARLRASPCGLGRLRRLSTAIAHAITASQTTPDADGWVELTIPIESLDHAVAELLSPELQVIEPRELRRRIYRAAATVQLQHEGPAGG